MLGLVHGKYIINGRMGNSHTGGRELEGGPGQKPDCHKSTSGWIMYCHTQKEIYLFTYFKKIIYLTETARGNTSRGWGGVGEVEPGFSLSREPHVGLDLRTEPEGRCLTKPPRRPQKEI